MKCPQCKKNMKSLKYDIGYDIKINSFHCDSCGFNVTDENKLSSAISKLRERMNKDVKVVAIGEGLGIRFPKEFVEEFSIKKGSKLTLKPKGKNIEINL